MKSSILVLMAVVLAVALAIGWGGPRQAPSVGNPIKQQGVCWVAGRQPVTAKEFGPLVRNHINWISQTSFGWQSSASDTAIRLNTGSGHTWWGESDTGIAVTARLAKESNIKTLLKPHLWVRGGWPGEIEMPDAQSWNAWFANYRKFILHYARLAEANKIEILCIGTELSLASAHERKWRDLIKETRKVYSGKLTYAANFNKEYERIKFWDALDFIGIQAYFPLSDKAEPNTEELMDNWLGHLRSIEEIHRKYNKPVLFTEIGYRSTKDAAIEPWKWPQENRDAVPSAETQARCYEAFFKSVWQKEWLAGAYFWKWYPHGGHALQDIDFTPQGKLAEAIILKHFGNNHDR
ncbi:MAG TPA: hypothetical protein PKW06_02920 [Cyclobacteriaceae bacterium]|nr:hypothetical protein [Cyclobacteriaceae bacterium]